MLQINLLTKNLQANQRNKRISHALIEAAIFSIIVLVIAAIGLFMLSGTFGLMQNGTETQIKNEEKKIQNYSDLEKSIQTYQENSKLYDEALKNQFFWSDIIIEITDITPENLQITQVNFQDNSKDNSSPSGQKNVSFSGKAKSRRDIAKLVKKLEDSEIFESVKLESSTLDTEGIADFKITAQLIKSQNE